MKAFVCMSLLAVAAAAPAGPVLVGHVGHIGHVGHVGGQASHQSVVTGAGEVRTLTQNKAFGATHSSVHQADNAKGLAEVQPSIAANRPVAVGKAAVAPIHSIAPHAVAHHAPVLAHAPVHHAVHAAPVVHAAHHAVHAPVVAHPVAHAVHAAPVVAHAVHAPVVAHAAPVVVKAAPVVAPVVVKAAPAYHAPAVAYKAEEYPDEVSPYTFTYAVADDYSKANFNAEEQSDGASNVAGSYSVALPDGRIQHVKYSSNGYDGYVADVTYEGTAQYPEAKPYHAPAPAYAPAPVPAYHA